MYTPDHTVLTKPTPITRPRRKTMNLGKNLGPPKRIKINEESIPKEKDVPNIIPESDSSQNSNSKESSSLSKVNDSKESSSSSKVNDSKESSSSSKVNDSKESSSLSKINDSKESSSSLKVNDSKEFSSSSKVNDDNENIQPKKLNITCEDQSNNKIKQHSSEDFEQEVKVSNITEQPNQEIVKKELSPVVNEPSLQSSESKQINANPVQNINTNQILLNGKTYTRIEYLGRGGSSKVYKVKDSNSQVFALKKVSFHKVEESTIAGYINEIDLLEKLYGRTRIIKLYDHEIDYEKKHILMLMECGQIDLAHLLNGKTGKPIKIDFIRLCWQQMLEAVYTIQLENIVHSDLKPANFIVINGSLKLIDFGIARTIPNDTTNIHREQQVGTINYMSPESIQGNNNNVNKVNNTGGKLLKLGRASDVWSLGCILYQLVYGHTPFSHLTMIEKIKSIPDPDFPIEFPPTSSLIHNFNRAHLANQENNTSQYAPVDANLLRIMKSCLKRNPKDRVTIPELLADPFLSGSHVPLSVPILDNLIREIIRYSKMADITHDSHEQITMITKSIFSQLRNKEPVNYEKWKK